VIRVEGLGVRYGEAWALRDVSLEIPRGGITAIVGPSGCGKSSFLAALNRLTDLMPGARVEGRVLLDGHDVRAGAAEPAELRRRVGTIFQKPSPFPFSIRRNVQLALREHGERDARRLAAITEGVLRDVGLWDEVEGRLDQRADALSGGQQQRLCIARALALRPDVLLLDEPCSSLDPLASAVVEELLLRLRGDYTLVVVTHDLAQARRIADTLAVFWLRDGAGALIEHGPAAQLFAGARDATAAAYLRGGLAR